MAFNQYLRINGENLPLPDSYEISLETVEADSSGQTEAGTVQRDVIRTGVITISVNFSVSPKWLKKLTAYSKEEKLTVVYFDTEDLSGTQTEMYVSDFSTSLEKDTSYKGLWTVKMTLTQF